MFSDEDMNCTHSAEAAGPMSLEVWIQVLTLTLTKNP